MASVVGCCVAVKWSVEQCFLRAGVVVARWWWLLLAVTHLVVAVCALGLLASSTQSAPEDLWVEKSSQFSVEQAQLQQSFGKFYRINTVLLLPTQENGDALEVQVLAELWKLQVRLEALQPDTASAPLLPQVCAQVYPGSPCVVNTVLDYWPTENRLFSIYNDSDPHLTVSSVSAKSILGNLLDPDTVMGGITYSDGVIQSAEALMTVYLLNNSDAVQQDALLWEDLFLKEVAEFNKTSQYARVYVQAERSIEDALSEEIAADAIFIVLSYCVMIIYTSLALGRFDLVESKVLLGLGGIWTIILAVIASFGITSLFIPFTPITLQVLPFLMLGVGINDIFVLTTTFARTDPKEEIESRLSLAMTKAGPSVLLTSATNILSFAVGAFTTMPAVRYFCIQASLAVLINFILLITCFSALLVMDAKRVQQHRMDCLWCIKRERAKTSSRELIPFLFEKYYFPVAFHKAGIAVIIISFVLLFGVGVFGATQVELGLGVGEVVPQDSYIVDLFARREQYFPSVGAPVYIVTQEFDYTSHEMQDQIIDLRKKITSNEWINPPVIFWFDDFQTWAGTIGGHRNELINGRIPPEKFYLWLYEFLQDPLIGQYYTFDLAFGEGGLIQASRMVTNSVGLVTTSDYTTAIEAVRSDVDSSLLPAFPYSIFYVFFEQYLSITREAIIGLLLAFAAIFLVIWVMLAHFRAALLTVLVIGMIEVDVVGLMYFWSIDLNAVSLVNLIVATGLSVEFCAHIARAYLEATNRNTRQDKAKESLLVMGSSVLNGGATTLLGVLMLAFAEYSLFQIYYFRMYFSIVIMAGSHGIVFLPALLSIVGPKHDPKSSVYSFHQETS